MMAGIHTRLILVLGVLTITAAVGRSHQIQNGSFESGINPPVPPTPPRVSADPGTPNLTEPQTDQPFRPPFLGPLGWYGLANTNGNPNQNTNPRGSGGSSQQTPRLQAPPHKKAGHRGGGGGGGRGGGSHGQRHTGSQPHAINTLVAETTTPLYPDPGANEQIGTADSTGTQTAGVPDGSSSESDVLVRDPVWVANLRGSGPMGLMAGPGPGFGVDGGTDPFAPLASDSGNDAQSRDQTETIPSPAPPGLILGLMAFGTAAFRLRRGI